MGVWSRTLGHDRLGVLELLLGERGDDRRVVVVNERLKVLQAGQLLRLFGRRLLVATATATAATAVALLLVIATTVAALLLTVLGVDTLAKHRERNQRDDSQPHRGARDTCFPAVDCHGDTQRRRSPRFRA